MNRERPLSAIVAEIHDEAIRLCIAAWPSVLAYVVALTLGWSYVDQLEDFSGPTFFVSIVEVALRFWVVTSMLKGGQLAHVGLAAGFGTYFGLSLLSGLAIGLGVLLLVIPGVILFVRWMPLYGFGLVEGSGIGDAFSEAWQATEGQFTAIFVASLVPLALYACSLSVYYFATDEYGAVPVLPSVAANLALSLAGAALTAIGIAVYALLRPSMGDIAEVFE